MTGRHTGACGPFLGRFASEIVSHRTRFARYSSTMAARRHPKGTSGGKGGRFSPKAKPDENVPGQALHLVAQSRLSAIAKPFRRAKHANSQEDSFGIRARSVLERYRPRDDERRHDGDLAELREMGRREAIRRFRESDTGSPKEEWSDDTSVEGLTAQANALFLQSSESSQEGVMLARSPKRRDRRASEKLMKAGTAYDQDGVNRLRDARALAATELRVANEMVYLASDMDGDYLTDAKQLAEENAQSAKERDEASDQRWHDKILARGSVTVIS